ncbi:MAG: phage major capsid protein [Myxococcota bacterium]
MRNATLLHKADTAVHDLIDSGGYLLPEQATRFMSVLVDQPTLLRNSRILTMTRPAQLVEKIRLGERILRPANSGEALAKDQRARPDLGAVALEAKLFKAETRLSEETLEDNIERGALKETLLRLMAERVALDMEEIIVRGDSDRDDDPFLAQFDGLLTQAVGNVMHHGSDPADTRTTSGLFYKMLKAMPSEFKRDKRNLVAYVSTNSELDYRETLAGRATNMGDRYLREDAAATAAGVPVIGLPTMPDGQALLTNPRNIIVGIMRDIKVEMDKDVSAGQFLVVLSVRFHARLAVREAVVRATGITVPVASTTTVGPGGTPLGGRIGDFTFNV